MKEAGRRAAPGGTARRQSEITQPTLASTSGTRISSWRIVPVILAEDGLMRKVNGRNRGREETGDEETGDKKPGTRNRGQETRNRETRNREPETGDNQKPG